MAIISDTDTTLLLLQRCANQAPDKLYATFQQQSLSVGELSVRAGRLAAALSATGIQAGDRVAVMLDNSIDYVELFFALIWLGAIHIPVNTRLRHSGLHFLLNHASPKLIIVEQSYLYD
ncbi:MAG: crotonobetaine/carnitine-CoA ligase, partial [Parasphingorhabdus sp.]